MTTKQRADAILEAARVLAYWEAEAKKRREFLEELIEQTAKAKKGGR